jgi:hypothetical protein
MIEIDKLECNILLGARPLALTLSTRRRTTAHTGHSGHSRHTTHTPERHPTTEHLAEDATHATKGHSALEWITTLAILTASHVIHLALLVITQHVMGMANFLELLGITTLVWMVLAREVLVCASNLRCICIARYT